MQKSYTMKNYLKMVHEVVNLNNTLKADEQLLQSLNESKEALEKEIALNEINLMELKSNLSKKLLNHIHKNMQYKVAFVQEMFHDGIAYKKANLHTYFFNKSYNVFESQMIDFESENYVEEFIKEILSNVVISEEFAKLIELNKQYQKNPEKVKTILTKNIIAKKQKPHKDTIEIHNKKISELTGRLNELNEYINSQPEYKSTLINKMLHKAYFKALEERVDVLSLIDANENLRYSQEQEVQKINNEFNTIIDYVESQLENLKMVVELKAKFSRAERKLNDFKLNEIDSKQKTMVYMQSEIENKKADLQMWANLVAAAERKLSEYLFNNFANAELIEDIMQAKEENYSKDVWKFVLKAKKNLSTENFSYIETLL